MKTSKLLFFSSVLLLTAFSHAYAKSLLGILPENSASLGAGAWEKNQTDEGKALFSDFTNRRDATPDTNHFYTSKYDKSFESGYIVPQSQGRGGTADVLNVDNRGNLTERGFRIDTVDAEPSAITIRDAYGYGASTVGRIFGSRELDETYTVEKFRDSEGKPVRVQKRMESKNMGYKSVDVRSRKDADGQTYLEVSVEDESSQDVVTSVGEIHAKGTIVAVKLNPNYYAQLNILVLNNGQLYKYTTDIPKPLRPGKWEDPEISKEKNRHTQYKLTRVKATALDSQSIEAEMKTIPGVQASAGPALGLENESPEVGQ